MRRVIPVGLVMTYAVLGLLVTIPTKLSFLRSWILDKIGSYAIIMNDKDSQSQKR